MSRTQWNPVFQVIFVFKKKVGLFLAGPLNIVVPLAVFLVLGNLFKELFVFKFNFCSHLPSAHGELRDGSVPLVGAGGASGVFFFLPAVVNDLEGFEVVLLRLLVLALHAFKQIIL